MLKVNSLLLCKKFLPHLRMPLSEILVLWLSAALIGNFFNQILFIEVNFSIGMKLSVWKLAVEVRLEKSAGVALF